MNEFFCSIGKELLADIDATSKPPITKEFKINDGGRIFGFWAINKDDITEAMSKIKLKKIFVCDNITCYFLKISFPLISSILELIFNISMEISRLFEKLMYDQLY